MSRSSRLQFLATMSYRSANMRGGRTRSFSDGPNNGGRGQFVTGDSHFPSVRQGSFSNEPLQQPPPSNQNQRSRYPRTSFNQNQNQYQAVRAHRRKPLDYRTWEYAKVPPPPNSERFIILSYNLLADYLAIDHRGKLYYHIPRHMLDWEWRKRNIIFELGLWSADVMCFQEVDKFEDLELELRIRGYCGIWKMRTGNATDGCAIFWRTSRFKLLYEESIEYNKLGLRDNVAQICVLEMLAQKFNKNGLPVSTSSPHSSKVVICNIHVLYNPKRGEIKLGQVRTLLDKAYAVSKNWNNAPVLLCGDFNCTPKSPLYNFISEQKLDLSGVDRDKVSGQASAQIHSWKPYNPNPRDQPPGDSIRAPLVIGEGEVGINLSNPLSHVQNNNNYGDAENIPFLNNASPSQSNKALPNLSYKAFSNMQCMNESTLSDVAANETEQMAADGFKESSSFFHSEGQFPADKYHSNDEICKLSHSRASHLEDKSDLSEMGDKEKTNASSHSNHESSSEHSDSNILIENDGSCDYTKLSLVYDDHSRSFECSPEVMSASNSEIPHLSSIDVEQVTCSVKYKTDISGAPTIDFLAPVEVENLLVRNLDDSANKPESLSISTPDEAADKLENLSMRNLDEAEVVGNLDEYDNAFLSELHKNEDFFPSSSDQFVGSTLDASSEELRDEVLHNASPPSGSEAVDVENITYDPTLWTPVEIATATGNEDCTFLEHPLQLKSTYTEVEDGTGTRDSNGEPLVTSYNRCFMGTVDYIWHSSGIQTVRVLAPMPKHAMQWTPGFPTKKWGSDHIALVSEVAVMKD